MISQDLLSSLVFSLTLNFSERPGMLSKLFLSTDEYFRRMPLFKTYAWVHKSYRSLQDSSLSQLFAVSSAWFVFFHFFFIVVGLLSLFLSPISSVGIAGEVFSPFTNENKPSLLFAKVCRVFHSARLSVFFFKVAVSRQTFCGDFGLAWLEVAI